MQSTFDKFDPERNETFNRAYKSGSRADYKPPSKGLQWNLASGTWGNTGIEFKVLKPQISISTANQGNYHYVAAHQLKKPRKLSNYQQKVLRSEFLSGNFPRVVDSYKPNEMPYHPTFRNSTGGPPLDPSVRYDPVSTNNVQGYGQFKREPQKVPTAHQLPF